MEIHLRTAAKRYTLCMFAGHAHIVKGTPGDIETVLGMLQEEGIDTAGNPDLYVRRYGNFAIDDARQLTERASLRALGERRVFVIAVDSINAEAQHALLKTLEEPPGGALFVFLHTAPETLLPTVRSRAQIISLRREGSGASTVAIEDFIKAAPVRRLDLLKPLLEKGEDEKRDMGDIFAFLADLERSVAKNPDALHAVYRARRYINDRGALVKPLLEQVALLV